MSAQVLVVEDNALVTDAMRVLLEAAGHEVAVAATVAETIEQCLASPPAVMLLDLSLPDGHGLDALARLAEADRLPGITVALTGHDDPRIVQRCRDAGCREVLLKPVPARELMARVSAWVAEAEAERAGAPDDRA